MNFSVWARKNPTDSFGDPLATAQVEFDGGPKSIDIVQRGLNEVQIRIISREVEQLADRLTASSASQKDPGLNALVMTTANAILKELGFPPLPSNR